MSEGYVLCRHFSFYFFLCLLLSNDLKCSTHLCIWSSRYLECILVRSWVVLYMYKALMFLLLLWLPSCEVSFLSLEFFLTFVLFARTIIGLWSCLFWCSFLLLLKDSYFYLLFLKVSLERSILDVFRLLVPIITCKCNDLVPVICSCAVNVFFMDFFERWGAIY